MTYLKPRVFLVLPNPARRSTGGFSLAAGEAVTCREARHGQLVFSVPQPRHSDIMVHVDAVDRKVKSLVSPDTAMCGDTVDRKVKPWS